MSFALVPQTREPTTASVSLMPCACYGTIGSVGTKIWGCGGCCYGERGTIAAVGRVAMAHFGCCVGGLWWMCGCYVKEGIFKFSYWQEPQPSTFCSKLVILY